MALFGKKKAEETTKPAAKKVVKDEKPALKSAKAVKETKEVKQEVATKAKSALTADPVFVNHGGSNTRVLVRPHVTEKATDLSERANVYAFEVTPNANKSQVKIAVEKLYKVTPLKVAIVVRKAKYSINRSTNRRVIKTHAMKKALVYLKKGDKIEFV